MSDQGQVRAKREAAARARRLAAHFSSDEDRAQALAFADDLDREANALESETPPAAVGPVRTQIQMQVQQGPPAKDGDGSEP